MPPHATSSARRRPHPHCHAIVSLGLFRPDGVFLPMEDIDFSGLEAVFRERFFALMLEKQRVLPETVERMRAWEHSGFNVNSERLLEAHDRRGLEGLLSYMERAPLSLRRLTYHRDRGLVHYQGTRFHPRLGRDHQLLPPIVFLALLIPHILLRYEIQSRTYGAVSTARRKKAGWIEHPPTLQPPPRAKPRSSSQDRENQELEIESVALDESPAPPPFSPPLPGAPAPEDHPIHPPNRHLCPEPMSEFERKRRRRWARLLAKVYGIDPEVCPACGSRMRIVSAFTFPEQESVIERILRHLDIWDPPWKKVRSPRGPPPPDRGAPGNRPPGADSRGHPDREEWHEAIDPPHPDLDFEATPCDEGME